MSSQKTAPAVGFHSPFVQRTLTTALQVNVPQVGTRTNHRLPEFGVQLNIVHIAHCKRAQITLDQQQLAWGTIYELARGVTRGMWTFEDMTEHRLRQLKGSNAQAAWKVAAVIKDEMGPSSAMRAPSEVWYKYDREQLAIVENKGRGLGTMGDWEGKENWYGGKIQQAARIVRAGSSFKLELEKPEIRRSHRFARFLGSRRILQIRVPDNLIYDTEVPKFLQSSKFVLCGRVFVPFHAKEGNVYLFETNENIDRQTHPDDGDAHRLTLHEFVQWHNPLRLNSKQPISKWSTRWALGLSTSVPTIKFASENIFFIDDQYAANCAEGEHLAEKIMTDGCGLISGAALTAIMRVIQYPSRPTAVQGRIAGAKGMWVLHPDPEYQVADGPPKIWIRNSQHKINCGPLHKIDDAHRIFDLVAPSRVTGPSRLSKDTLVNLAQNDVPTGILKELMANGLNNEVRQLTEWDGSDSMILVWRAVERAGRVVICRLRRRIAGQARAFGLGQLRPNEELGDEIDDDGNVILDQSPAAPDPRSRNPHSGQPTSLYESVLELLQAGFHPLKLDPLFNKLKSVVTVVLDDYVKNCHIPVKESLEAYITTDPYGVLEEGQIHFRSSQLITDPESGTHIDIITGPVLIWRIPTRLPSDVQKVTAVSHPKLSSYFDVIIFPVKGERSLASYLGGGDTAVLVWSKNLVENFNSSPLYETPVDLRNDFERDVEHLLDFDQRVSKLSDKEAQTAFQKVLLLGLVETKYKLYSGFHDAAVYQDGYDSTTAIRLAYMFTTCLDAKKSGLRVKQHVFEADRKKYGSRKPYYKVAALKKSDSPREDPPPLKRISSSPFILDDLVDEGNRLRDEYVKKYSSLRNSPPRALDHDTHLTSPYTSASYRATQAMHVGFQGLQSNLTVAKNHVDKAYQDWLRAIAMQKSASCPGRSDPKEQQIQKVVQYFAQRPLFQDVLFFSAEELKTIMASYAYTLNQSFGFSVAFRELCAIKARAQGEVPFEDKFAQVMNIPNNVLRALSQAQDDVDD
ncbi:RNA dependent RNA polymerase-domain-containing protein [Suillus bovinus]|uniref:RNA dependent RNA polymerase-domain-containing protein n=1 Tax=Suillus bovinus TaxID=48563 RepID=UPI001B868404|nr:RNA dependent RNA polymerase-domain-containing protein [Suillus bovinus]KAG2159654.1 RNA dependent RNA polymerase-domain-containing protein [Suillus bovinus]